MSTFTPFSEPLCLAIAASTLGLVVLRRQWPALGHWAQAAALITSLFGVTLFGRLFLDLMPSPWSLIATIGAGVLLPLLSGMRQANAGPDHGDDAFARQGFAGILFALTALALALALGSTEDAAQVPHALLVGMAALPALVGVSVLRDARSDPS